jgi:hypothetical protein
MRLTFICFFLWLLFITWFVRGYQIDRIWAEPATAVTIP